MTEKQRMKLQYSKVEDLGLHKVDLHSLFLDPSVCVLGFLFLFLFFCSVFSVAYERECLAG